MSENKIRDFFNSICKDWNNENTDINRLRGLVKKLNIKEGDRILDLGCGKGIISPLLYEVSKCKVTLMDFSEEMIKEARKMLNDLSYDYICEDFYSFNTDQKFDYIMMFNCFPHFIDFEALKKKLSSVLNDGGRFCVLHDIGRGELNTHHEQHAKGYSRPIDSCEIEYMRFSSDFKLLQCEESDNSYLIECKKL